MNNNTEDRKWLHKKMQSKGYDVGSYDEFEKSLQNKDDADWYYNKANDMGLDIGSREDFDNLFVGRTMAEQLRSQDMKPYTHEYDSQGNLVGGTAYQDQKPYQYDSKVQQRILENKPEIFKPKTVDMYGAHDKDKSELDLAKEGKLYQMKAMRAASTIGEQLDERIKANEEALNKAYAKKEDRKKGFVETLLSPLEAQKGYKMEVLEEANLSAFAKDEDIANLVAEKEYLSEAKKVFNAAKNDAGFFQGMKDAVDTSFITFGMSDLLNAKQVSAIQQKLDAGESLSESEQSLLTSLGLQQIVDQQYNDLLGRWYKAGKTTAEMAPFMAEMAINPLSGLGKAAMKASVKKFGEKGTKAVAAKMLSRTIGDVAGAAGMTATSSMPSVAADALSRQQGYVTTGLGEGGTIEGEGFTGGKDAAEAWRKAYTSRTIENWSEMAGEYFSPVGNVIGKGVTKGLNKIGLGKVNEFLDTINSSNVAKILGDFTEQTQWNGPLGEFAEEQVGMIADALLVGDTKWSDITDLDKQLDVALGVGVFGTFMSLLRVAGYRTPKYRARMAVDKADKDASKLFGGEWANVKDLIDSSSDEELTANLSGLNVSPEQMKAAFMYANALKAQQAVNTYKEKEKIDNPGNVEVETEAAYDEGAELKTPYDKHSAKRAADRAEAALGDDVEFAKVVLEGSSTPVATINAMAESGKYTEEQIAKAKNYYTAINRMNGMTDVLLDEVDSQIESANVEVDMNTNKDLNQVVKVVLRDGRAGYVINGTVTPGEKNTVDVNHSDSVIYVRLEDGEVKQMNPHKDLAGVAWIDSPENLKNENNVILREKLIDKGIQEIDWNPATPNPKVGDSFEMDCVPVTIVSHDGNGGMFVVPTEEWQAAIGSEKKQQELIAKAQQMGVVQAGVFKQWASDQLDAQEEAAAVQEEQSVAPEVIEEVQPAEEEVVKENFTTESGDNLSPDEEVVQPQAPVIPTKEDGNIDFVAYGKENSFKELGNLYGEKMPRKVEVTAKAWANDVAKAQRKLDNAQQKLDDAPIGRDSKQKEARDKAQQEFEAIKKEADFWAEMDAEIKAAQSRRESMLNPQAEVDSSAEPQSVDEFVAQQLASGNIVLNKEDFKRETGFGTEEVTALNGGAQKLLTDKGMTIQEAGERLMEMDRENGTNFFDQSDPNAGRDALIDLLGSVKTRKELNSYIKDKREYQAERETEALRSKVEDFIRDNFHMTPEDYATLLEVEMQNNPYEGVDLKAIDAIFAEKEFGSETLNEQENESEGNVDGNSGKSELLSEEQVGESGRDNASQTNEQAERVGGGTEVEGETSQAGQSSEVKNPQITDVFAAAEKIDAEERRRRPLRSRINEWVKALGVKVVLIEKIEDAPTTSIRAEIENAHKNGQIVPGWVSKGQAYFFLPDLTDTNEVDKTFIHEVVAHKGLKEMLGEERFNKLCDKVWEMMSEKDRTLYENYPIVRDMEDDTERHRAAADEYIAALSEKQNLTPEQQGIWDKIVQFFRDALDNALNGIIGKSRITNADIANLIKASYANLKSKSGNIAIQIEKAREEVDQNPTEAQKEAGNYKKGHVKIDGYDITIENPKGGVRSGTDKNGKKWSITMNNDYGYIRNTEAVDGDHIDVFLSDNPNEGNVFVVDQSNEEGSFDESKVMYGFNSLEEARKAYLSNYEEGWESRIMAITEVSKDEFKKWIDSSHRKTKAFSEYNSVKIAPSIEETNVSRMSDIEERLAGIEGERIEIEDQLNELGNSNPIASADLISSLYKLDREQADLESEYSGLRAMNDESNAILEEEGSELRFKVYKSKDGKETKYKQLSLFGEGNETIDDRTRPNNLQREGDSTIESLNRLRELQEGEICNVERKFTESKEFSFTRGEKVESTADVAYIFKSLEDEAIENSFVAVTNGDNVTVLHLGMGAQTQTVVDTTAIFAAVERLGADKIFFVHNHPTGNVKCSRQDVQTYQALKDTFGDKLQDGIIINTRSGKYGLFNSSGLVDDEGRIKEEKNEYPISVYKFNKQAFNVDEIPSVSPSSYGIAEFVSTQRLGKRDKINVLLLNNNFGCVGNILIDNSKNTKAIVEKITNDAIAMGARQVVIYGRYPFVEVTDRNTNFVSYLSSGINKYSQGNVSLLDIIQVGESYSKSANDEGVRFRVKFTPEEQTIIKKAKTDGSYMLAPNGEPTNLTEKQWAQVRTKAFKTWFGDWENDSANASKVVDENGEPLIVYHGTDAEFEEFDKTHNDKAYKGFFFTEGKEMAASYGKNVMEVFLNIREAYEIEGNGRNWNDLNTDIINYVPKLEDQIRLHEASMKKAVEKGVMSQSNYDFFKDRYYKKVEFIKDKNKNSILDIIKKYLYRWQIRNFKSSHIVTTTREIEFYLEQLDQNTNIIFKDIKDYGKDVKGSRIAHNVFVTTSPNQIKSATDNVGTFDEGNNDIRFRFIGERGARNLDKEEEATTRLDNLAVAREMEAAEKDAKTIKMATGWERGADGLWRYEVDDNLKFDLSANVDYRKRHPEFARFEDLRHKYNANLLEIGEPLTEEEQKEYESLVNEFGGSTELHRSRKLKDYVDAPELFEAYPELRNIDLSFAEMDEDTEGKYLPKSKSIQLNENIMYAGQRVIGRVLVHEIQHAIQDIEGFEPGANKDMQNPNKLAQKQQNIEFMQNQLDKHVSERNELLEQKDELNAKMSDWYDSHEEATAEDVANDKDMSEWNRLYDELESKIEDADRKVSWDKKWLDTINKANTQLGIEGYAKVSGEVEARNVMSRLGMTLEQRRNSLASETEDVAREDQIFLKDGIESGMRFRLSEKGKQIQAEVDKFTSKYNSKPVRIVEAEMDDNELMETLGYAFELEDVKSFMKESKTAAGYFHNLDKIIIFADKTKVERMEEYLFHENIHAAIHHNNFANLVAHFYEYAKDEAVFEKWSKLAHNKEYKQYNASEEFLAYVVSNAMVARNLDDVAGYLGDKQKKALNKLFNVIGYDYDIRRRSDEQSVNGRTSEETSGEPSLEGNELQDTGARGRIEEGAGKDKSRSVSQREQAERLKDLFDKVADMGLDGVLGNKQYGKLLMDIYNIMPDGVRREVNEWAITHYGGDFVPAMSDYLNKKASANIWDKIVGFVRESLRKVGFDLDLNSNDVKYMLWRSQNPMNRYMALDVAEDIDARRKFGVDSDSDVRFSVKNNNPFDPSDKRSKIVKEYDNFLKTGKFNFIEAFQDRMYSVKVLMDMIVDATGKKVRDFEDAYTAENQLGSINKPAEEKYLKNFYKPLVEAVKDLSDKYGRDAIERYIYCKSGLERNEVLRQRDADEAYKDAKAELDEKLAKNQITQAQYDALLQQADDQRLKTLSEDVDYSGIRGMLYNIKAQDINKEFEEGKIDKSARDARLANLEANRNTVVKDWKKFAEGQVSAIENAADPAELKALWKKINAATNETLRMDYESGMIDKATYDAEKNMMKYYVPLRNWSDTTAEEMYEYRSELVRPVSSNQKRAKGRKSQADNPIATIALMAQNAIVRGNRNKVKQKFYAFVANRETGLASVRDVWYVKDVVTGDWIPKYADASKAKDAEEFAQILDDFEQQMKLEEEQGNAFKGKLPFGMKFRANRQQKQSHVVPVMINGKEYAVYVNGNPRPAQAMNGETNSEAANASAWYDKIKRIYGAGLTSWNPDFIIPNMIRDGIHASTMTFLDAGPIAAAKFALNGPRAFAQVFAMISGVKKHWVNPKNQAYFEEFIINGGETGYTAIHTLEDYKKEYDKLMKEVKGLKGNFMKNGIEAMAKWLEAANRIFEDVNRFNAYVSARESGESIQRSVNAAKNITVNFNRKGALSANNTTFGTIANFMSKWILFFNPAVQGIAQLVTKTKVNPKRAMAMGGTILASGFFMPMLNEMLVSAGGDDEEDDYWNQSDYKRRNNWLLFTGNGYVSVPLPPVLRELYGIGDIIYSSITGHITPERAAMDFARQAQSAVGFINLIPEVSQEPDMVTWAKGFAPDIAAPVLDVISNTNFMGRPIAKWTDFNEYNPEYERVYKGVSPQWVELSKLLNKIGGQEGRRSDFWGNFINPAMMEHLVTSYGGGIGKTINNLVGMSVDIATGNTENLDPFRKSPIVPRFYTPNDEKTVVPSINRKFYDYNYMYNVAKKALKNYQEGVKTKEHPEWQKYIDEMKANGELEFIRFFENENKRLKKIQNRIKEEPSNKKELEERMNDMKAKIASRCYEMLK